MAQNPYTLVKRSDGVTHDACMVVNGEAQAAALAAEKVIDDLRPLTEADNNKQVQVIVHIFSDDVLIQSLGGDQAVD